MKYAQPRGIRRGRVKQLLLETSHLRGIGSRIEVLSGRFLGRPYKPNPLIGSADGTEVFTASLDGFDCVTYIETVLALARASDVVDFINWLRKIRYRQGRIRWEMRNHYTTDWIRNNVGKGIIRRVSIRAIPTVIRKRVLNIVPGLPLQRIRLKCVPKVAVPRLEPLLHSGDLIFFASTRKNLDIFHAGIIVRNGNRVLMRHASRSRGLVVEQQLREFLRTNRMAGVIVARPHNLTPFKAAVASRQLVSME